MSAFNDPAAVEHYVDGPPRKVPGFVDMQRMARLLMAESAPEDARVLVVGAGGGLELKLFAEAHPGWGFDGIDPAAAMLRLAERTLGPLMERVTLHEGYVDTAPEGPFDAASCLLTLHFVAADKRLSTLTAIRRRLKPGAPLVVAHFSLPAEPAERELWMSRYAAFAVDSGVSRSQADEAARMIPMMLPILTPETDEALLAAAGFQRIGLFYVGLTFRGWVAYA